MFCYTYVMPKTERAHFVAEMLIQSSQASGRTRANCADYNTSPHYESHTG